MHNTVARFPAHLWAAISPSQLGQEAFSFAPVDTVWSEGAESRALAGVEQWG